MFHATKVGQLMTGLIAASMLAALLAGCSQTAAPEPNAIQRAQGETVAAPPPSGFLGSDYALLKPGAQGSGACIGGYSMADWASCIMVFCTTTKRQNSRA